MGKSTLRNRHSFERRIDCRIEFRGRGQPLYSSLSFGAAGSLLSGYAWESIGPQATWLSAAVAGALAAAIVWRWLKDPLER